jgi:hypothetical protein
MQPVPLGHQLFVGTGLNYSTLLNPVANPANTTLYTLNVRNNVGCIASDKIPDTVIPYCLKLRNAFIPSSDGINGLWLVYDQFYCLKNVSIHVYNRYGS